MRLWPTLVLIGFLLCAVANGKAPKSVTLSDSDVAVIHTALGFTTMLQFDSRPGTVVLGDQDAFKVEYAGNSLVIKPVVSRATTNLFVMTDYDRFSFKLMTGPPASADYVLKISRPSTGYPVEGASAGKVSGGETRLIRRKVDRSNACGGLRMDVSSLAWPESRSTYLVEFQIEASGRLLRDGALAFDPGDIQAQQGSRLVPIESLYLEQLFLDRRQRVVHGTLVLRQSDLLPGMPLKLGLFPDFHRPKFPSCPWVSFPLTSGTKKRST